MFGLCNTISITHLCFDMMDDFLAVTTSGVTQKTPPSNLYYLSSNAYLLYKVVYSFRSNQLSSLDFCSGTTITLKDWDTLSQYYEDWLRPQGDKWISHQLLLRCFVVDSKFMGDIRPRTADFELPSFLCRYISGSSYIDAVYKWTV